MAKYSDISKQDIIKMWRGGLDIGAVTTIMCANLNSMPDSQVKADRKVVQKNY